MMISFRLNRTVHDHLPPQTRRGAALLFCLFLLSFVTLIVVHVFDTTTQDLSALRNTMDYERALYLANAGVHQVAALLHGNITWRGTVTDGSYPADNTFTATAVNGPGSTVVVTASGVSGNITRTVQAILE